MNENPTTLGPRRVRLVCVHSHTAAPGKSVQKAEGGRKRKHAARQPSRVEQLSPQKTAFQTTFRSAKDHVDLLFKALKTFLILRNTG